MTYEPLLVWVGDVGVRLSTLAAGEGLTTGWGLAIVRILFGAGFDLAGGVGVVAITSDCGLAGSLRVVGSDCWWLKIELGFVGTCFRSAQPRPIKAKTIRPERNRWEKDNLDLVFLIICFTIIF